MFGLIKKIFIGILTGLVNGSNHTNCISFSNQKCEVQHTLISLNPNEYSQKVHYYPFAVKLDICVGSCNTLNDLSNKVCVAYKTQDLNLIMFNIITGINESKILTKHISCECKCIFDGRKRNLDQWWKNNKCLCECKKRHVCERAYAWNNATCNCENGKYLASIMDNSTIKSDEIMESSDEEIKTIPTNFTEKKATCRMQNLYILLAFYNIIGSC